MTQNNIDALKARWPSLRDPLEPEPVTEIGHTKPVEKQEESSEEFSSPADPAPLADDAEHAAPVVEIDQAKPVENQGESREANVLTEPVLSVNEAQRLLAESHLRTARATDQQRACRGHVALALERFQRATMQTITQEQLIRQHIASENQLRADRAAGKIAPRPERRLGSAVDAFAFHTRATGRGAGGARAFSRSAYPPSMRGRVIPKSE